MKKAIPYILIICVMYFVVSFFLIDFDFRNWGLGGRGFFLILSGFAIMLFRFSEEFR